MWFFYSNKNEFCVRHYLSSAASSTFSLFVPDVTLIHNMSCQSMTPKILLAQNTHTQTHTQLKSSDRVVLHQHWEYSSNDDNLRTLTTDSAGSDLSDLCPCPTFTQRQRWSTQQKDSLEINKNRRLPHFTCWPHRKDISKMSIRYV